jgi:hypothetical protein
VTDNIENLRRLCAAHGVLRLELFGSAAREDFDPAGSDFDFLVEFGESSPADGPRSLDWTTGRDHRLRPPSDAAAKIFSRPRTGSGLFGVGFSRPENIPSRRMEFTGGTPTSP